MSVRAVRRTIWLPAEAFGVCIGAPTKTVQASRWRVYSFPAAAEATISHSVEIPDFWVAMNMDVYWSNPTADVGNVRWAINCDKAGDGESLNVSGGFGDMVADVAAPAQHIMRVTRFSDDPNDEWLVDEPTKLMNVRINRNGTNAADTKTGGAATLIGVRLRMTRAARPQ